MTPTIDPPTNAPPNAQGYFLDGQNPVQHPVRIGLFDTAVRFQTLNDARPTLWDFAAIDWDATRLLNGQLRIKHDDPDDAWLIVTDAAMIAAIMAEKKSWAQHHFWTARRELLTIVRATAATFLVCITLWLSWPYITQPLAGFVPHATRDWIADTVQTVLDMKQECRTPEGLTALHEISDMLTVGNPELHTANIVIVNSSILNAITLANDKILVTRALLTGASGPDEIAGIMAHELGHVAHRHILRGLLGQFTLKLLVLIFTGAHGDMLGHVNDFTALSHSREFEAEADTTAIALLRRAQISSHGLGEFFTRTQHERAAHGGTSSRYLSTHPPTADRAQQMLNIEIPGAKLALTPDAWRALQNICGALPPDTAASDETDSDAPAPQPAPKIQDDKIKGNTDSREI